MTIDPAVKAMKPKTRKILAYGHLQDAISQLQEAYNLLSMADTLAERAVVERSLATARTATKMTKTAIAVP
jgi:division protein CdvB (Snf7/Vps24/ESCRT-III family)